MVGSDVWNLLKWRPSLGDMLVFGGVPETPPSLPPTGRFLRDEQLKNNHSVVDGPWPQKINPLKAGINQLFKQDPGPLPFCRGHVDGDIFGMNPKETVASVASVVPVAVGWSIPRLILSTSKMKIRFWTCEFY